MADPTVTSNLHELLLALAGRIDDDLLAWARELVAVGEHGEAVELIVGTLLAERAVVPVSTRDLLDRLAEGMGVGPDPSAPLALVVDGQAPAHRFAVPGRGGAEGEPESDPGFDALLAEIAARMLSGCQVWRAWRLTPSGGCPGPVPHPVVLVEATAGAEDAPEVLAYQVGDALRRAGRLTSVEVFTASTAVPEYHQEAMRHAEPIGSTATQLGDEPPEPPGPVEPAEAVVVAELLAPVAPAERAVAADAVEPVAAVEPVEPVEPAEQVEPVVAAVPVEPAEAVDWPGAVEPVEPVEPVSDLAAQGQAQGSRVARHGLAPEDNGRTLVGDQPGSSDGDTVDPLEPPADFWPPAGGLPNGAYDEPSSRHQVSRLGTGPAWQPPLASELGPPSSSGAGLLPPGPEQAPPREADGSAPPPEPWTSPVPVHGRHRDRDPRLAEPLADPLGDGSDSSDSSDSSREWWQRLSWASPPVSYRSDDPPAPALSEWPSVAAAPQAALGSWDSDEPLTGGVLLPPEELAARPAAHAEPPERVDPGRKAARAAAYERQLAALSGLSDTERALLRQLHEELAAREAQPRADRPDGVTKMFNGRGRPRHPEPPDLAG